MKSYLLAILAVGLFIQHDAIAETGATASHEQAALELLELMGAEDQMLQGANMMIDVMTSQSPGLAQYRDVLTEWSTSVMRWEVFGPKMVAIYTDAFTEVELRELAAFYRTPTGMKAIRAIPELMQKGAEIGAMEAQLHMPRLQEMIQVRRAELEAAAADE